MLRRILFFQKFEPAGTNHSFLSPPHHLWMSWQHLLILGNPEAEVVQGSNQWMIVEHGGDGNISGKLR